MSENTRDHNIGESDYAKHTIQPWDIWLEYKLNPWDADIVKRVLRDKKGDSRSLDYKKIIHVCQERLRQLEDQKKPKMGVLESFNIYEEDTVKEELNYLNYDELVDWTKFNNPITAFHGQKRWSKAYQKTERFDYYETRWIGATSWEYKYKKVTND